MSASSDNRRMRAPTDGSVSGGVASFRSSATASSPGLRSLRAPNERLERLRDAKPVGHRLGPGCRLDQGSLGRLRLRGGDIGDASDRFADRGAHVGLVLDLQPCDQRRKRSVDRGGRGVCFPPLCRLTDRVGRLDAELARRVSERGNDVGNQCGTLEAAERTNGSARRRLVAAVRPRTEDREIARQRRPAILGLQDGEACDPLLAVELEKDRTAERAEDRENCFFSEPLRSPRFLLRSHGRRWRVAAE